MFKWRKRKPCPIQKGVKIICPLCSGLVVVPMCKAVNGEKIICSACGQEFLFPA